MSDNKKLAICIGIFIMLVLLYIPSIDDRFIFYLRSSKILVAALVGIAISVSSFSFQTITNNNIITPGIIGFDSLFLLIQTVLIFISSRLLEGIPLLLVSTCGMLLLSGLLFKYVFLKYNLFKALLFGTILSILFRSICSVLHTIMDPNAFDTIQSVMFTNFNSIDSTIVPISIIGIFIALYKIYSLHKELDILSLGKDLSNTYIDRNKIIMNIILYISILVSISTSLVGPVVFIGLFVSNLTRILFHTYRHEFLLIASIFIGSNIILGGIYLNDTVFTNTNLPVVIDGLGALYFIYLCIKRSPSL